MMSVSDSPLHLSLVEEMNVTDSPPQGCSPGVARRYTLLCDLEAVWGVVLESLACGGVLACLVLGGVLLGQLRRIPEPERRSGAGPVLLMLPGIVGLFGLSFTFLIETDEVLCAVQRALWGALFALCFSCLLVQGWRVQRLAHSGRSPRGGALAGLALALTAVQGIIAAEWLLLTVVRQGQPACLFTPLDFALACTYVMALLLAATITAGLGLCGKDNRRRCNAIWLFITCLTSVLLWATWLGFYLYGNEALDQAPAWDNPVLAVALVAQGWVLLLLHAVPETYFCLRPAPHPETPDYFDTSQPPPRLRETSFDEDLPLSRPYMENHAFSFDEHSAALRPGYRNSSNLGLRNSGVPFRSNVYQPTEMAVVLNGGTIPSAPPNYTGRPQW